MQKAVVLVADAKNFAPAVFVVNRLKSLNPPSDTDLVIVSDSDRDIALATEYGLGCRLVRFDLGLIERSFPVDGHLTQAAYYRVFLPHTFAAEYGRILYLDCDTYPQEPTIFGVLDVNMHGFAVGGVQDFWSFLGPASAPPMTKTLNSGVLLIDTRRYLDLRLQASVLEIVASSSSEKPMLDQEAINRALAGDFLPLSPSFNMSGPFWTSFVRRVCQPVIVHFAGPIKPWHGPRFSVEHPARAEMERFLPQTPWKSFLTQHYGLEQARKHINQRGFGVGHVAPHQHTTVLEDSRIVTYLQTTVFADVAAGLTTLKLEHLPLLP